MTAQAIKKEFVNKFLEEGKDKFYRSLLIYALNKLILIKNNSYKGITPDLEFLDYYHRLIIMYRREDDFRYLEMAKIIRRAAHRIYRIMLKKNLTSYNSKFLNLV